MARHSRPRKQRATPTLDALTRAKVPAGFLEAWNRLVANWELPALPPRRGRKPRVPVRDLESIIETLGDYSSRTKDLDVLSEYVRNSLGRTICKQYVDDHDRIYCLTLDPALEDMINGHIDRERGNLMPPQTAQTIVKQIGQKAGELTQTGRSAVVLCSPQIRLNVRRMIEPSLPQLAVLAYNEIAPEVAVEAVAIVGMNG